MFFICSSHRNLFESEKHHTIHLSLKEFMKTTNTESFVVGEKLIVLYQFIFLFHMICIFIYFAKA